MTKQHMLARIAVRIEHTTSDIRRKAQLIRRYRAQKQTALKSKSDDWQIQYEAASLLEYRYTAEREMLISQLQLLKGITR